MDSIASSKAAPSPVTEILAYPVEMVPVVSGVTRTQVFEAIKANELTARKCGRRTIIEVNELRRWIATFPTKGRVPEACGVERMS